MKLKYELEILDIGGDMTAVPIDSEKEFRGILQINGTTASILKLLEKDTDEDTVVKELQKEYDADEDTIRRNVQSLLEKLRENHLLAD